MLNICMLHKNNFRIVLYISTLNYLRNFNYMNYYIFACL